MSILIFDGLFGLGRIAGEYLAEYLGWSLDTREDFLCAGTDGAGKGWMSLGGVAGQELRCFSVALMD